MTAGSVLIALAVAAPAFAITLLTRPADLERLSDVLTPSWEGAQMSARPRWAGLPGRNRPTVTAHWFFNTLWKGLGLVFGGLVVVFVVIFLVTVVFGGGFGDR